MKVYMKSLIIEPNSSSGQKIHVGILLWFLQIANRIARFGTINETSIKY